MTLPITSLGNGILHRAIVSLPDRMTEHGRPLQERIVFFETLGPSSPSQYLENLLAAAWCMDTAGWVERGFIYNIDSADNLLRNGLSSDGYTTKELRLLETGSGGELGVGIDRIHYARNQDVDLFVTPQVATRLHELLRVAVEELYKALQAHQ